MGHDLFPVQWPETQNWVDGSWAATDGGPAVHLEPDGTHKPRFTMNTGNVNLTQDTLAFSGAFVMTGYSGTGLDFDTFTIKAGGDVTLDGFLLASSGAVQECGGNLILNSGASVDADITILMLAGTGSLTITSNGVTMGHLEINDGGGDADFTLVDDLSCGDFTLTDGELIGTGQTLTASGDVTYVGGEVTNLSITMTGDESVIWSTSQLLSLLTIYTGATVTSTGHVWTKKLAGAGAFVLDDTLEFSETANGFWAYTGQIAGTGTVDFRYQGTSPGSTDIDIDCTGGLTIRTNGTDTMTFGAALDCNAKPLHIEGTGGTDLMTVNMVTFALTCGALKLGDTDATSGSAVLNMGSGIANLASVIMGNDANDGNVLAFDTKDVFSTGIIDGNNAVEDTNPMTITSVGANLHGGTLLDAAVSGPLHCWGVTISGVTTNDVLHEGSNVGVAMGGMAVAA